MSVFLLASLHIFYTAITIAACVTFLSLTGTTIGVRSLCAKFLLKIFKWAAASTKGQFDEEEKDTEIDEDEVSCGASCLSFHRHQSLDYSIILPRWTAEVEQKLHYESSNLASSETDTIDGQMGAGSTPLGKMNNGQKTVKVIVNDTLELVAAGIEAIIDDKVTSRFKAAQLPCWNLLTRNRSQYEYINWKISVIWVVGMMFRYLVLVPARLCLFLISMLLMVSFSSIIGLVPNRRVRAMLNKTTMLMCMRISSRAFSTIVTFHHRENKPSHGICVANHTSPIDVLILSCDNCYAMIGQRQGGILGFVQKALSRCSDHIWFERSEANERKEVTRRLKEHVDDPTKLPILIFPEGTCINNTSVMMFKKGTFEVTDTVYPIALKYDHRLGDPFWNSSEQGYMAYLLSMITAWALVCDVWYLPPVTREENETPIDFARRVQKMIAKKGGMVVLDWDGNLKRNRVPERLKLGQKELLYQHLARNTSIGSPETSAPA